MVKDFYVRLILSWKIPSLPRTRTRRDQQCTHHSSRCARRARRSGNHLWSVIFYELFQHGLLASASSSSSGAIVDNCVPEPVLACTARRAHGTGRAPNRHPRRTLNARKATCLIVTNRQTDRPTYPQALFAFIALQTGMAFQSHVKIYEECENKMLSTYAKNKCCTSVVHSHNGCRIL